MSYRVGIDIGGTFTDCVALNDAGVVSSAKTLSTHSTTPVDGVLTGLSLLADELEVPLEGLLGHTSRLSHGTTIGTNLVVERKGARVGLIASAGHGDALRIMLGTGRTAGLPAEQLYNAHVLDRPSPLVPPRLVVEVDERIAVDGEVLLALSHDEARLAVARLVAAEVDAIAVALLWSVANPVHEHLLREVIRDQAPDVYVSLSSDVSSRAGEYERTVATVINSYVGPASSRYLGQFADRLIKHGLRRRPYIMKSDGGVGPLDESQRIPLRTIGSGPAGGMAGVLALSRTLDIENVIGTDMGGTSFEVGLIVGGKATLSGQEVLDKYSFHVTHLDLRSIACGGGSIATVDPHTGGLRVGPESAGADPGPACYGRGTAPTVTDADVVLGLIDPATFLGGRMALDRDSAVRAIGVLAEQIGLTVEQTAAGIVHINSQNAAMLIRERTIEQGLDPRDFSLFAYGGAGPVHAFSYAKELGVSEVIVPLGNGASTLSAYGAAAGDIVRGFELQCTLASPFDGREIQTIVSDLETQALAAMREDGINENDIVLERTALLRYAEQYLQEIAVTIASGPITPETAERIEHDFIRQYARMYSDAAVAVFQSIELFGVRVAARVTAMSEVAAARATDADASSEHASRYVYWPGGHDDHVATTILTRAPSPGEELDGPALIELPHTTVAVGPGQRLDVTADGSLRIIL
jgi:N-methylhydantoinase A